MIAGIGRVGAVIAHDEDMVRLDRDLEGETTWLNTRAEVGMLIQGHPVDRYRVPAPLAGHRIAWHADKPLDQVIALLPDLRRVVQPVAGVGEDDDIPPAGLGHTPGDAVGGQDSVIDAQRVLHGTGGNDEGGHDEESAKGHNSQHRHYVDHDLNQGFDLIGGPWLLSRCRALIWCGIIFR